MERLLLVVLVKLLYIPRQNIKRRSQNALCILVIEEKRTRKEFEKVKRSEAKEMILKIMLL